MGEVGKTGKELVQEISQKGDEVPERYLLKDGYPEAIDLPPQVLRDTLLIDFSLLMSSSSQELAKLRSALCDWGCFQVINHGMESSLLDEMVEVSKQFFGLSQEEKLKSSGDFLYGYGNDSAHAKTLAGNWNDRLYLTLLPKEKRQFEVWPQSPQKFREVLEEYSTKTTEMVEGIYKAMAKCLNLEEYDEEGCFSKNQGEKPTLMARINYYPPCPCPEQVLGVKPHADATTLTVLLEERGVEGLQVEKDDHWFKMNILPGALFCNVGYLGEAMSNGMFKSAIHRVTINPAKDRLSVILFHGPDEDIEIGAVSEVISSHRPQLYRKFNMIEFKKELIKNYYHGSPLDSFKLH